MTRFYASIDSDIGKTTPTRRGKASISAHVRGWDIGGRVTVYADKGGRDRVVLTLTHGSNGGGSEIFVDEFILTPTGIERAADMQDQPRLP